MVSWFVNNLSGNKTSSPLLILILFISNQLHLVYLASISNSPKQHNHNLLNSLDLKGFSNDSDTSTRPLHHDFSSHPKTTSYSLKDPNAILLNECMSRPLSPKLWMDMDMDEFLRNYRNGDKINLPLANQANLTNFDCGIEKLCYADQLCHPVKGKEWYILVAAQEWNTFMNAAYQSIGWAMTMMQGVAPSLVHDFYPDLPDIWSIIKAILTFASALAKVIPTEGLLTWPKWWYQLAQGEFGLFAGISNLMDDIFMKNPVNQHDKWTTFSYALSISQDRAQMSIAKLSQATIEAGISSENGMYGVLKDGNFLMEYSSKFRKKRIKLDNIAGDKESEMKLAVQLHLLAAIWTEQNYFITRGSDPCTQSGPNGAWAGDKVLSYCGPDNVMMNIIRAKGDHAVNKVHNARLVSEKYNFGVQFLTESAWRCQEQSGKFGFDVWNATDPVTFDDLCSFNLPVCDLTQAAIRAYRDSGQGTVRACRIIGGLPI